MQSYRGAVVVGGTCNKRPCAVVVFCIRKKSSLDDAFVSMGGLGGYSPSLLLANKDHVLRWMIANKNDVLRWMMHM